MKLGLIGYGWVGKSMHQMFPEAVVYDKHQPMMVQWHSALTNKDEARELTMKDVNECDIAVVSVPTDLKDGKLDMSIVEEVVKECTTPIILIRSTLMPGTADILAKKYNKRIVVQPEYLGETAAHPLIDESKMPFIILGGEAKDIRQVIELYQGVYNANIKIRQVSRLEAEVIKMSENRAIAFKVAQCQELYDVCEKAGVDYYTIRDAVYGDDPRMNLWFTFIYPDKRGFKSKCIPKDIYGWAAWAESVGFKPRLTRELLAYNETLIK
jgi:UDPglucose 6-dehydrogenase